MEGVSLHLWNVDRTDPGMLNIEHHNAMAGLSQSLMEEEEMAPAPPDMKEFLSVLMPRLCQLIQASLAVRSLVFQWMLPGVLSWPLRLCSMYWTGSRSLSRISLRREM